LRSWKVMTDVSVSTGRSCRQKADGLRPPLRLVLPRTYHQPVVRGEDRAPLEGAVGASGALVLEPEGGSERDRRGSELTAGEAPGRSHTLTPREYEMKASHDPHFGRGRLNVVNE
jgi:hypothetical protein